MLEPKQYMNNQVSDIGSDEPRLIIKYKSYYT
jgi:hypothetical protein